MKKKLLLLLALVLVIACAGLASCDVIDQVTSKLPFVSKTMPNQDDPFANVTFADVTGTYDGQAKTMAVAGLPTGAVVVYSVDGADPVPSVSIVDAGTYTVEAQMTSANGKTATKTATLTIAKADRTVENLEQYFDFDGKVRYDGAYHTPQPNAELPDSLICTTDGAPLVAPGQSATYTISFEYADPTLARNYNPPAPISGVKLTIEKGLIDMSGVVFEDLEVPFDNGYHAIEITGVPSMLNYRVSNGKVDQGQYEMTATFFFKNSADAEFYELPAPLTATLTIGAGQVTLPNIFIDKKVAYNGNNQRPVVPGGIEGIASTETVVKNAAGDLVDEVILPGEYTVTVTFTVTDPEKYLTPDPVTYVFEVTKAPVIVTEDPTWAPVGGWDVTVGEGGYFVKGDTAPEVAVTLPETFAGLNVVITYKHKLNGIPVDEISAAGVYTTTAILTLENDLYAIPEGYSAGEFVWLLSDKEVNTDEIDFADKNVVYNGEAHKLEPVYGEVAGLLGVTVVVTDAKGNVVEMGDGFVNAGVYTVTATFETDAAKGYAPLTVVKVLTIEKAMIDLSGITAAWNFTQTEGKDYLVYDGETHVVELNADVVAALEALDVTVTYSGNKAKAVGEYVAVATLSCDANHQLSVGSYAFAWQIANVEDNNWSDTVQ